jgi:hypothetical protein
MSAAVVTAAAARVLAAAEPLRCVTAAAESSG